MRKGTADAFGGHNLPFYALHSRLYLMIAFSRIAYENPKSIVAFAKDIAAVALGGLPHALIQKVAATTALTLEAACPGTFMRKQIKKLESVGVSPFAVISRDPRDRTLPTPWHKVKQSKAADQLHFGIDFGPYWFQRLGNVFGLSEDDITDRVSKVARKDIKIPKGDGFLRDPRTKQWKSVYSRQKDTSHSHGSYPFIDDFTFYVAYHSLMSVGARLLKKMPTVHCYSDDEPWPDWLRGHELTRQDGRWLADRRDPTPIKRRRRWTQTSQVTDTWRWELQRDDFADVLLKQNSPTHPICVHGLWIEMKDGYTERIFVSSALADPAHSHALAADLRSYVRHEQHALPPYDGPSEDWSHGQLTGWINNPWKDLQLDQFDPLARRIKYPPRRVAKAIASSLGLKPDPEGRYWTHLNQIELINEIWSDENIQREDHPYRWGERMTASISFLKRLCATQGKDLLIKVEITRNRPRHYESYDEEREGYIPPSHNVFVFSASGILTDGKIECRL